MDSKYNLFLDDFRELEDAYFITGNPIYMNREWVIVRNYNEFVGFVKKVGVENIQCISYDHDLADEHYKYACSVHIPYDELTEKTGYHCVKWLCEYCMDNNIKDNFPETYIHTQNVVGGKNIIAYVNNFKKHFLNS